jgi:hypothetical protein
MREGIFISNLKIYLLINMRGKDKEKKRKGMPAYSENKDDYASAIPPSVYISTEYQGTQSSRH